jgi:putative RecB family exonuclease
MPPKTGLAPPKHISFSAREQLMRCAKSFFLSRMAHAPQRPALWLAGGSAVHEVTEEYDRAKVADPEIEPAPEAVDLMWAMAFNAHLDKLRKAEPNEYNWRSSSSEPIERWNVIGPQFVQSYIDWRQRSPYEIWTTPDGVPAIELDISGYLPGCPVEIKAYLDRVFHDPVFDQLIIVDLKTSKRPPKNSDQFATYAALLAAKYPGVVPALGAPFMNRKATLGTPYPLLAFTPEAVGEIYGTAWEQIQSGEFPATPGEACFLCDVSASCYAKNGPLASRYDPDHENYEWPPF